MLLRKCYELEKTRTIDQLILLGYHRRLDGKQLYECTLTELKYTLKCFMDKGISVGKTVNFEVAALGTLSN